MEMFVVNLLGDVDTRVQIGCEEHASDFADWAEKEGYQIDWYRVTEPIEVDTDELLRVAHVMDEYYGGPP